ncbi:MAG: hypothetical protein WCB79_03290 [Halobacteriota archaeon]
MQLLAVGFLEFVAGAEDARASWALGPQIQQMMTSGTALKRG